MRRYKKKKAKNIDTIIAETHVDNNINIRDTYNNALQYEYNEMPIEISEKNLNRILVNNIRHDHSNYDINRKQLRGDNKKYYTMYKNTVLNKISDHYPYLQKECDRQKRKEIVMIKINKHRG